TLHCKCLQHTHIPSLSVCFFLYRRRRGPILVLSFGSEIDNENVTDERGVMRDDVLNTYTLTLFL
ncbi:hypothetical protein SCA6_008122, partial [Theobroma cacao]